MLRFDVPFERLTTASFDDDAGVLACLDGYMNIAMEQTEVRFFFSSPPSRGTRERWNRRDSRITHSYETRRVRANATERDRTEPNAD
jgi:hypothetical protein